MTEFQAAILLAQIERFDWQARRRVTNFDYFREVLKSVGGVKALPEKPEVTARGAFGYPVEYNPSSSGDLPVGRFVEALHAEGIPVRRPHQVVYQSPLWLSGLRERWTFGASTVSRLGLNASCPAAERISDVGFVLRHNLFLGNKEDIDDVIAAMIKVCSYADELM